MALTSPLVPSLTMLQINSLDYPGQTPPNFTRPPAFDGVSTGPDTATDFVVQVDPLQTFSAIPEPSTLALAAIGFLAMGRMFPPNLEGVRRHPSCYIGFAFVRALRRRLSFVSASSPWHTRPVTASTIQARAQVSGR